MANDPKSNNSQTKMQVKPQVKATLIKAASNMSRKFDVRKAEQSTQIPSDRLVFNKIPYIEKPYKLELLEVLSRESTIIPQCITAYKNNIPGFGYEIVPVIPPDDKEMISKLKKATDDIASIYLEYPLIKSYKLLIDQVERYGYGAFEVIRSSQGKVQELINIDDLTYFYLTTRDKEYTEYKVFRDGIEYSRKKKFRRIVQFYASEKIYYKEFGDPRIISNKTGLVLAEAEVANQANEIIWIKAIDLGVYGVPRWEGIALNVQGMRLSEKLNHKYFISGRHIPLMILIKNGTLTDAARTELQGYMTDLEGDAGQHAFMLLEFDQNGGDTQLSDMQKSDIQIQEMSKILQKDELFSIYQENGRKKVQSSFMLPDIYVGYTQDYNVATAREATKKTEEQVFQPERNEYEMINNQILWEMGYTDLKFKFNSASVENTEFQQKMFDSAIKAGGITPNEALKAYVATINVPFNKFDEDWSDTPIQILNANAISDMPGVIDNIEKRISKAENENVSDEVIAIMKDVRKMMLKFNKSIDR